MRLRSLWGPSSDCHLPRTWPPDLIVWEFSGNGRGTVLEWNSDWVPRIPGSATTGSGKSRKKGRKASRKASRKKSSKDIHSNRDSHGDRHRGTLGWPTSSRRQLDRSKRTSPIMSRESTIACAEPSPKSASGLRHRISRLISGPWSPASFTAASPTSTRGALPCSP